MIRRSLSWVLRQLWRTVLALAITWSLASSTLSFQDTGEQVRRYTRADEFDFVGWTAGAIWVKVEQAGLGATDYLRSGGGTDLVKDYLQLNRRQAELGGQLADIFGDPSQTDPRRAAQPIERQLAELDARRVWLRPLAESVVQEQVSVVLAGMHLALGGEVLPPVAFHATPLPLALIVSPRQEIRQEANVELNPGLALNDQARIESQVEQALDVSALVVPIGGIGVYPTMVQETSDINWLTEVVSHEWTHNYLTLHPLGLLYDTSPELRTMNETTASLMGVAIGQQVVARYYPDLLPPPPAEAHSVPGTPPAFNFHAEMHATRVEVDALLAAGQVTEAEAYMEARRQVFWAAGYHIRRLNQAYFAFYGAYADEPQSAAGNDPVGAAVRQLWERASSPTAFLRQMAGMRSFADLQTALARPLTSR
jgi:hypothetical protein